MCLGIPMQIVSVDGDRAEVESAGVRRTIGLALLPEAAVGDEVLVHAGYALSVLDPEEAAETRRLLGELFAAAEEEEEEEGEEER